MKIIKKLFDEIDMSWKKIIIFSILAGVYTGVVNQISFLKDTSFRDMAISYEAWILFAVIIVSNCKKPLDASLKCFVFFLISQPLVYIVELPTLGYFPWNYYRFWFFVTILTLPGGFIAYYINNKRFLGVLITSIANIMLIVLGCSYINQIITSFPCHFLSIIFCFGLVLLFTFYFGKTKRNIIINSVIAIITIIVMLIFIFGNLGNKLTIINSTDEFFIADDGEYKCSLNNNSFGKVRVDDGNYVLVTLKKTGKVKLICISEDNEKVMYNLELDSTNIIKHSIIKK